MSILYPNYKTHSYISTPTFRSTHRLSRSWLRRRFQWLELVRIIKIRNIKFSITHKHILYSNIFNTTFFITNIYTNPHHHNPSDAIHTITHLSNKFIHKVNKALTKCCCYGTLEFITVGHMLYCYSLHDQPSVMFTLFLAINRAIVTWLLLRDTHCTCTCMQVRTHVHTHAQTHTHTLL